MPKRRKRNQLNDMIDIDIPRYVVLDTTAVPNAIHQNDDSMELDDNFENGMHLNVLEIDFIPMDETSDAELHHRMSLRAVNIPEFFASFENQVNSKVGPDITDYLFYVRPQNFVLADIRIKIGPP